MISESPPPDPELLAISRQGGVPAAPQVRSGPCPRPLLEPLMPTYKPVRKRHAVIGRTGTSSVVQDRIKRTVDSFTSFDVDINMKGAFRKERNKQGDEEQVYRDEVDHRSPGGTWVPGGAQVQVHQ